MTPLRQRFIDDLNRSKPRFIVRAKDDFKVWVKGEDTTRIFPALTELIENQYHVAVEGRDYIIYERN